MILQIKDLHIDILPRFNITNRQTFIFGAPKSGKTSLALHFAKQFEKAIYIDSNLYRSKILLPSTTCIIIDNINKPLKLSFKDDLFVILIGDIAFKPDGFNPLYVPSLNFEEFLSLDKKGGKVEHLLSEFIKNGSSLNLLKEEESKKLLLQAQNIKLAFKEDYYIFYSLLSFQARQISINTIYLNVKKYEKISKDRIYTLIKSWKDNKIIFFCMHKDLKKQKLYFYDFSLSNLTQHKSFASAFLNMVFLELNAKKDANKEIFYSDEFDFILEDIYIICLPFASLELVEKKIEALQKSLDIQNKNIFIITITLNFQIAKNINIIDFTNLYMLFG